MHQRLGFSLLIVASIAAGCQSTSGDRPSSADTDLPVVPTFDAAPVAYLDGRPVTPDELFALMVEASGGQALSELLLDRAIDKRLAEQGMALTDADLAGERERLLATMSDDPDQATRLLRIMRDQRGLGVRRFTALLRRNAGLRMLVRDGVTVGEAAIRQAYAVRYGQRHRVRLITAETVDAISTIRREVTGGASFSDLATVRSTDPSSAQGGLLSPISPADATYPKSIREALPRLSMTDRAGRLSPVIALPEGYALLWLEEVIAPDGPPIEEVRDRITQAVRLDLERVRMQQLARVLIGQANVVVLDPALDQAWQRQRGAITDP